MCLSIEGRLDGNGADGDPLSEVLEGVRVRCTACGRHALRAPWGFRHDGTCGVRHGAFLLVRHGACWLEVGGVAAAVRVEAGDVVVLPPGAPYAIRDRPDSPVRPFAEIFGSQPLPGEGDDGGTAIVAGTLFVDDAPHGGLSSVLPPVIHVPAGAEGAPSRMAETVAALSDEAARREPGARAAVNHLAHVLFVRAVRHYAATLQAGHGEGGTWLRAMFDEGIGPALGDIHRNPDAPWTVASLADRVAMSRSAFAAKFTALVGEPPARYLARCRMDQAVRHLRDGRAPIKEIAARVGYESEAAFSHAFKRRYGVPPGAFRGRERGT